MEVFSKIHSADDSQKIHEISFEYAFTIKLLESRTLCCLVALLSSFKS